jgi:hypothetical protein
MYTTGIRGSVLGFCDLGNHSAGYGRSYEYTGSISNVTGRGTCSSKAAVRGAEPISGKSSLLLITDCTSPMASIHVTIQGTDTKIPHRTANLSPEEYNKCTGMGEYQ